MAILHFFCDESGKYRKNPVVSITGIGADRSRLDQFDSQWRALLDSYGLLPELHMARVLQLSQANGPKMSSGQSLDERIDALLPFADCINNHLEIGLVQAWDVKGYSKLSMEVKRHLGGSHDPYQLAFIRGLLAIKDYAGKGDVVNVICDDDEVTAWDTYMHFRAVFKALPEIADSFVGISFAKSQHYTPLQAADMVAFLVRREASARFWHKPNEYKRLADYLMADPKPGSQGVMHWYTMFADEQQLVNLANDMLKANALPEIQQSSPATPASASEQDKTKTEQRTSEHE